MRLELLNPGIDLCELTLRRARSCLSELVDLCRDFGNPRLALGSLRAMPSTILADLGLSVSPDRRGPDPLQ